MKITAITSLVMTIILLFLCSPVFSQTLPESPATGGQLLASKGCLKCHSIRGKGGSIGPDLGEIDLGDTQLDLAAKMWNHTPSMISGMAKAGIAKPTLTGQEFANITAYLYFLRYFDEQGYPESGQLIFEQKNCSYCHPLSGRGKEGELALDAFPRNISPVFLSQALWNHSLEMMARMLVIGKSWPIFADTEMIDLLAFIKTQAKGPAEPAFFNPGDPREGKRIFDTKGCNNCHSIRGEGKEGGIDLGIRARDFYTSLTEIASHMWNKAPQMILVRIAQTQCGIPKFTSEEMSDLLAYLYFLHYVDEPGNRSKGEKLFSDLSCSQCHIVGGKHGKLAYINLSKYQNATPLTIVADIWNHNMEMREAMNAQGIQWPQLKKGDMADLLEFIRNPEKK
jgi:mono/diheme cytochrome c family protein